MKIKVSSQAAKVVSVNTQGTSEVIAAGIQGPSGPSFITSAGDVDATALQDGSVLVYKSSSLMWTATTTLDQQNLEGGHY